MKKIILALVFASGLTTLTAQTEEQSKVQKTTSIDGL